jgi:hypothetical protein
MDAARATLGGLWSYAPSDGDAAMKIARDMTLGCRLRLARLQHAVMRWESAVVLALTILAVPGAMVLSSAHLLPESTWMAVLAFGLVAEAVLVTCSVTDSAGGMELVQSVLTSHFGAGGIDDGQRRALTGRAIEYRARMEHVLRGRRKFARGALTETEIQVDGWVSSICRLARRLDEFQEELAFQTNAKPNLRSRVAALETKVLTTATGKLQRQLRETLAGGRHQIRAIEDLEGLIERADLRLEHAVGALGTVYSQVTLFAARGVELDDAARLAGEISEETREIENILTAMGRVHELDAEPALQEGP